MIMSEKKQKVQSPAQVSKILQAILLNENETSRDQEHFWVIGLNHKNVIQYVDLVSLGTVSETILHPREVYRLAVHKGVSSVIVAHNHPSGELTPSAEDKAASNRLKEAGKIIGIALLDALIISQDDYISFKENGYLE